MTLARDDYRRIALDEYFLCLASDRIDETLAFFHPDATFTLFPHARTYRGRDEIAAMYRDIFSRHATIDRRVIDCVVDPATETVCASFEATARNRSGEEKRYFNVNFWRFSGSRFAEVKVYTSDPNF